MNETGEKETRKWKTRERGGKMKLEMKKRKVRYIEMGKKNEEIRK